MKLKNILIFLIAATAGLSLFVVPVPAQASPAKLALYVSQITGYAGVMLLLWFYILGTKGVMKIVTKNMAPITDLHKWLGKYATVLIFFHPLFITISYGESWLYSFVPNISTEFDKHVTYGRIAFVFLLVVWITSALLRSRMGYRPWKYFHLLAYMSLPFALLHIPDTGSSFHAAFAPKLYFFAVVIGFGMFSLLRLRSALGYNKFTYEVLTNNSVADRTYMLHLKSTHSSGLLPKAGQYIYLKTGWFSEEHPFSVLANDTEKNELYVAYRVFGAFTKELSQLQAGSRVLVNGSFGVFTREVDEKPVRPVVFVAGGIGITPFVSRLLAGSEAHEQWLFYVFRTRSAAPFLTSLEKSLGAHCVPILSNAGPVHGAHPAQGIDLAEHFRTHLQQPERYSYFLCGPEPLMDAAESDLVGLGVSREHIYREAFSY